MTTPIENSLAMSLEPTCKNFIFHPNGLTQKAEYDGLLSSAQLQKIIENYPVYKKAADGAGIPWQMLAAVHYREDSLSTQSRGHGGPFQFDPPLNVGEEDFAVGAFHAAQVLQTKSGIRLYPETTDDEIIKDAFYGYNGRKYGNVEQSPYVMNSFDAAHTNMRIRGTVIDSATGKRKHVDRIDQNLGAYTFYLELRKAFL